MRYCAYLRLPEVIRVLFDNTSLRIAVVWLGFALLCLWQIGETRHGIAASLLLGLVAVYRILPRAEFKGRGGRDAVSVLMSVFSLLLVTRTLTSPHLHTALAIAEFLIVYPIAYFAALRTRMPGPRVLFYVFVAPLLAGFVIWALWDHFAGRYIFGPASDANGFAAMMGVLSVTAVGLAWLNPGLRWPAAALAALAATALYLTESRGALVALVLLCFAVLVFRLAGASKTWHRRQTWAIFGGAFVAAAVLANFGFGYVSQRLQEKDISLSGRVALLETAVNIGLTQGPWVGEGVGTFTRYYPELRPITDQDSLGTRAHSDYFELFADGGLLLALALVGVSAALWRSFALAWYRGSYMQAVMLSGAVFLALFAALNHTYINVFLSLMGGLMAGWGMQHEPRDETTRWLARCVQVTPVVVVALLVPVLAISSIAELHVRAAVAPSANALWSLFRTEVGLRHLAHTGVFPRVSFVYGLRAESALNRLEPGDSRRSAVALTALDRYVLAYQQDTRNSNYAYQIARLLANYDEFAARPDMDVWTDRWFRSAVRLDKLNFRAAISYSRWLASRGRHEDAIALLQDRANRVHRGSLRQPLLDEIQRIATASRDSENSEEMLSGNTGSSNDVIE